MIKYRGKKCRQKWKNTLPNRTGGERSKEVKWPKLMNYSYKRGKTRRGEDSWKNLCLLHLLSQSRTKFRVLRKRYDRRNLSGEGGNYGGTKQGTYKCLVQSATMRLGEKMVFTVTLIKCQSKLENCDGKTGGERFRLREKRSP